MNALYGTKYSIMDQVKFVKDSAFKKIFKGCIPQILRGPFFKYFVPGD